jgi:hypothetical protein
VHRSAHTPARSVLPWDTGRRRGNNLVEHTRQGLPPVLHFADEIVVDGRNSRSPSIAPWCASRADSVMTRLASCGIAALVAQARREAAGKAVVA